MTAVPVHTRRAARRHPRELLAVAENVIWFKPPSEALADAHDFLAHVMTYGTLDDVLIAEKYYTGSQFREALEHAPPGVFDIRSWTYWNLICGRDPVPPLPQRRIPGVDHIPNLDPCRS
jgi:hypothetical protein